MSCPHQRPAQHDLCTNCYDYLAQTSQAFKDLKESQPSQAVIVVMKKPEPTLTLDEKLDYIIQLLENLK